MKRLMVSLLAVAMVCLMHIPGLAATEESYTMEILVNGSTSCQVEQGDTVTVTLTMTKDGASNFDLYCMQDYVCFDPAYWGYEADSLQVYTMGGDWKTPVFQASAVTVPAGAGENNRVFVNRVSDSVQKLPSGVTVLSFQLTARQTGSTELTHGRMEVFRDPANPHQVSGQSASVTIVKEGSGTQTPAPQPTASAEPSSQPTASAEPAVSTAPDSQSAVSVQPSQPVQGDDVPSTGDHSQMLMYVVAMAAAVSLLCATAVVSRKRS